MAYDASQNKLVAFAGADTSYVDTNTTFVWSAGSWSTLSPPTSPSARRNLAIAYDPIRQRTVLFSGISGGGFLSDTWELNAAGMGTWTKLSPSSSPPPRYGYNMFFDPDIGKVCVFGSSPLTSEDLWQWDGTTWTEITMIGTIDSKYAPATTYDAFTHSFVAFGGRSHDLSNFVPTNNFGLVRYRPNKPVEACFDSQIDYDNDGKFGCADEECWPQCDPLHSPGIARPTGAPFCGDTVCTPGFESCSICPGDCGQCTTTKCGDFHCDSTETPSTCPNDC
jgi:hypothetical protein